MSGPSISVAMATYNGGRFLREQLESLVAQHRPPIEVQIGDDGSTDDTAAIVAEFAARAPFPVHFHRNEEQLGFGENFIRTARRCRGEWIAYCDQDDVWLPEKLERCARAIAEGPPELALVAHNAIVVDEALRPLRSLYDYPERRLARRLETEPDWHCVGFSQVVRARLVQDVPSRPRPSVPGHPWRESHDVWTAILANATGSVLFLGPPLALYRRHESTVTNPGGQAGFVERLRATMANNAAAYRKRAGYLHSIASILRSNSEGAPDDLAGNMVDAAGRIDRFAETNERRASLYEAAGTGTAFASFRRLLSSGAYGGGGNWPLGAKAMMKDAAAVVAAPLWRRR